MGIRALVVLAGLLGAEALAGRCAHLEHQEQEVPRVQLDRGSDSYLSAYARAGQWQPIRIAVYYGQLNITEAMKTRLYGAMNGTVNWLSQTLRVRPVLGRWRAEYVNCGDTYYPEHFLKQRFEADFVLFVFADMEINGIAGYASTCEMDATTDQPVVGRFYFNGGVHKNLPEEQVLSTAIHEISHALGFSPFLFKYFRKADGTRYRKTEIFSRTVRRNHNVTMLAFPTVTQKAREAFGCESLQGLELETDGGSGTVGAHWEKRLMNNDFMVADNYITDVAYSDVTMAVFEDSGWYKVSYRYTTPINWGFHQGCEFITEQCVEDSEPLTSDFCTDIGLLGCDFLGTRKGRCDLNEYDHTVPSAYDYFDSPSLSGSDYYLDFCPVVKPFGDGDCRDKKTAYLRYWFGENAGLNGRCLVQTVAGNRRGACHEVDCDSADPTVEVGGETVTCPAEGGSVVAGNYGELECPPRSDLCKAVPCINNCYGFGYCDAGKCVCDDGTQDCYFEYGVFGNDAAQILVAAVLRSFVLF